MDQSLIKRNPEGGGRNLLFLTVAVLLLVVVPASLAYKGSLDRARIAGSLEGPAATMIEAVIDGCQKSAFFIVAALAFLSFKKLLPVLWPLFQASLSGLLIAAEIAIVFWLVYGGLAEIGMPGLFWSPDWWTTMRSAIGVTLFMYWMLYLVFVRDFEVHGHEPKLQVWERFLPVLEESGLPAFLGRKLGHEDGARQVRWFLAYSGLPVLLILAIPAVLPAMRPGGGLSLVEWPWLAGMALGVAAIAVIVWARLATRLHELWRQLVRGKIDLRQIRDLDPNRLDPHANIKNILVILALIQIVSYLDSYPSINWLTSLFPPAFSICVMLGVFATFTTYLGTRSRTTRLVFVSAILILLALAGMLDYEVEIHNLHDWYPSAREQLTRNLSPASSPVGPASRVIDLEVFQRATSSQTSRESFEARERGLDRWASSFHPARDATGSLRKPILVVVATSGGALRAALWTETVLGYLDQGLDNFHHHVRLITGASGGMLGAARYVSGHHQQKIVLGAPGVQLTAPDYLTPIAWQIAFRDFFPNALLPWATYNRGDALEDAWIEKDDGIALTFSEIKDKEDEGLVPSLIFSPMLVEDGRRLLISNLPLHDLAVINGDALLSDDVKALGEQYRKENPTLVAGGQPHLYDLEYPDLASVPAVEFFRLFGEESRNKLTLANAVRMSATFPYITSSVCLPTDPPRHVVDAGYYDNYGVNLAAAWVASHRRWITSHAGGVLLVQTRAFRNEKRIKVLSSDIHEKSTDDASTSAQRGFLERAVHFVPWLGSLVANGVQSVVMPLEGVAKARDSSMYFRNDEQLRGLKRMFEELTGDPQFFRSVIFTCDTIQYGQQAQNIETLNWYIDPAEFDRIRHNMEPFKQIPGKPGTGRDRNDMRFLSLANWWRGRGGKLKPGAPRVPPGLIDPSSVAGNPARSESPSNGRARPSIPGPAR